MAEEWNRADEVDRQNRQETRSHTQQSQAPSKNPFDLTPLESTVSGASKASFSQRVKEEKQREAGE